jgi:hypothetical protein
MPDREALDPLHALLETRAGATNATAAEQPNNEPPSARVERETRRNERLVKKIDVNENANCEEKIRRKLCEKPGRSLVLVEVRRFLNETVCDPERLPGQGLGIALS